MKTLIIWLFLSLPKKDPANTYILISMPKPVIGCGGILVAGEFLFINSSDATSKIGIILCPGDVFREDHKYQINFSKDSIVPSQYSMMNIFDTKEHYCPKRLIDDIKEIK